MYKSFIPVILFLFLMADIYAQGREEFNGAFSSWANVRTRFGAGKTGDDTKALQQAIDSLSLFLAPTFNNNGSTKYIVIYLPAGIYQISGTLHLTGKIACSIIGEDPEKTIIRWTGADQDTMLSANGSSYFKISRITWDGGTHKGIEAIGLHWLDNKGTRFAPTSIEFSDLIFKNLTFGFFGGTLGSDGTGANDAEVAIKRCRFYNCEEAAIAIKGYNALDYWIWDCAFHDCGRGIYCVLGNYHVYHSAFYNSTTADLDNTGPYYCSVRGCYSLNAHVFSADRGSSSNPFKRIFENNLVEQVRDIPIQYFNMGKITLMNNIFHDTKSPLPFTINYGGWYPAIYQLLSINNYYEDSVYVHSRTDHPYKFYAINDQPRFKKGSRRFPRFEENPFLSFIKRTVYEVRETASTNEIQLIVNQAASQKEKRAVIHFGAGIYQFTGSVIVPPNTDIQFVGDGILGATIFRRLKADQPYPFFVASGSSKVVFRDFGIQTAMIKGTPAIRFTDFDRPSAEVHLDQIYTDAKTCLLIENSDYAYFQKDNAFHSAGNTLIGGKKTNRGNGTGGLFCFGGQGAKTSLQNNAVMVVKDCWWEGAKKKDFLPVDLSGSGRFTYQGALLAPGDLDSTATIRISHFSGKVTLSDMYVWGGMNAMPAPSLKLFVWNVHFMVKEDAGSFINTSDKYPLGMAGISTACAKSQSGTCTDDAMKSPPDIFRNITDTLGFIKEMTADMRAAVPRTFRDLPSGTTNILISRVSVSGGDIAFEFKQD